MEIEHAISVLKDPNTYEQIAAEARATLAPIETAKAAAEMQRRADEAEAQAKVDEEAAASEAEAAVAVVAEKFNFTEEKDTHE